MRRKAVCIGMSVFMMVFLTGCWDMKEIEHTRYVYAIGVDYVNNNQVIYAQIIPFTNIAKQEGGGGAVPAPIWVGKSVGKTFDIATDNLYTTAQQRYSWGHVAALVFTERALKNKKVIEDVLDVLERYNEIRKTIWVSGTKERLNDLFIAKPALTFSIAYSRLSDPDDTYLQYSIVKPITLREFMISTKESGATTILPYLKISRNNWKEDKKKKEVLMLDGVGILQQGKFKGHMPRTKIQGIRWMQKQTARTALYIFDGKEPVASLSLGKPKIKITPQTKNGRVTFNIQVSIKGSMIEVEKTLSQEQLQKKAENRIQGEIRRTFREGIKMNADVFQLSNTLYRENPRAWHELAKNNELKISDDSLQSVEVKVEIYSSGTSKNREKNAKGNSPAGR
ncbi:Ger(x)C family germination protein [Aneurinibacillus soli]|uniref:Spore germination protein B3 n=1 Tax=Aneurinibacillus soli TaxID=1500254 RepID=A0A0U5AVL4_9BACL|nr:Ger(x)C family spore germination protein [Aneurinibacillus soli]PYE58067.1 Ger(x)C family germination protein [Aneurinibacillus soli]BAU25968.1 Spore germination protein B3 precursor [Aneurinibacillus soli]